MESDDSNQNLLSRRQSEMGSRYLVESGVYMSSFAATIFVAALATIGVLMLTLLVALTVMLTSCQNKDSGLFEQTKTDDNRDYCSLFAFHAELNNLEADEFPTSCKQHDIQNSRLGRFIQDFNLSVQLAEKYFSTLKADNDRQDIILIDIDDILLPQISDRGNSRHYRRQQIEHIRPIHILVLRLYMNLQASGWSMILFTRKHVSNKNATVQNLIHASYGGWSSLIMRSDDELLMESWEYISGRRLQLVGQGYRIAGMISSRMDSFRGPHLGKRNFKLANPTYYNLQV